MFSNGYQKIPKKTGSQKPPMRKEEDVKSELISMVRDLYAVNPYDVKEYLKKKAQIENKSDSYARQMCALAKKHGKWDAFGLTWEEFETMYRLLKEMQCFVRYERAKKKMLEEK